MNDTIFTLGNISIKWYSILILIGAIVAISIILNEGKRFKYSTDFLFNMIFWSIIFGIIGARLYYVIFNHHLYSNYMDIFKIWEGGLAIHGGILFGFITLVIYCKKYKMSVIRITDFVVPGLIIAQAIGRWGNFFNSEAYGAATTLAHLQKLHIPDFIINGMYIKGVYYHPTFFYESLWCILGFILLLIIRRLKYIKIGQITAVYLIWYGVGRFFIESLRTDSLMFGGFKVAQLVSVLFVIIGISLFLSGARKSRFEDLYNQDIDKQLRY